MLSHDNSELGVKLKESLEFSKVGDWKGAMAVLLISKDNARTYTRTNRQTPAGAVTEKACRVVDVAGLKAMGSRVSELSSFGFQHLLCYRI